AACQGAHLDTAAGPRAVLGSQRPRTQSRVQADSTPPVQSNALRAEDGSRSVPCAVPGAMVAVPRCATCQGKYPLSFGNSQVCQPPIELSFAGGIGDSSVQRAKTRRNLSIISREEASFRWEDGQGEGKTTRD